MANKLRPGRSPLVPIAIFAGITEAVGVVVLPSYDPALQGIFLWFLILFPILLILLFFATLNFNPGVLLAPSPGRNKTDHLKRLNPPLAGDMAQTPVADAEDSDRSGVPGETRPPDKLQAGGEIPA